MPSDDPRAVADRRLRWHCRRGLLELDLVLNRFVDRHLESLSPASRLEFEELLAMPDTDLWALISGKDPCPDERLQPLLGLLRQGGGSCSASQPLARNLGSPHDNAT